MVLLKAQVVTNGNIKVISMVYHIIIDNKKLKDFKGLDDVIKGRTYNARARVYYNNVKDKNDEICIASIKHTIKRIRIEYPIRCHFRIYMTNRGQCRSDIYAACEKSFLDALQKAKVIKNDGWNDVLDSTFHTYIDKDNPRIEVDIEVFNKGLPDDYKENQ